MRIRRPITVLTAASCLTIATASPALADGLYLSVYDGTTLVGTAVTYNDGVTYDVCDHASDDLGVRGYYRIGKIGGWTGTVSPGQGKCDSRKIPFRLKLSWIKLCEIYLGAERGCQETQKYTSHGG